ncbi:MAG TPA: RDD family protein [Sulfurospirillum arcachonense]|nr:RDD family protein [Sulfurospirillum arcachonense]HIP44989.1 RDD family protein [Sulfurospirillum arcachonense]
MTEEEVIEKFERENISLAPFPKRFFAYFIDEILVSFLFVMIYIGSIEESNNIEETINMINGLVIYIMILKAVYQTFFVWMYGATLGKIFMKIRVVSINDLENPQLLYSLNRAIVRILSESIFYLGFVWAFMNSKRESWHDKAGRTLVVNAF